MTLKKSSVNPFRFTFIKTCKNNFIIPIAVFLFSIYLFPSGVISHISNCDELIQFGQPHGYTILDNTQFVIARSDFGYIGFFIDVLCIICGALLAISIFRYAMNKKSVNVYFSLGITRSGMFLAKYLAGAVMLFAAVLIPVAISVIANIVYFGSSSMLWVNALYLFAIYFGFLLYSYTVTTLICSCVGTVLEAIVFGLAFAAMPVVLELVLESFFGSLVYGSPYTDEYYSPVAIPGSNYSFETLKRFSTENLLVFSTTNFSQNIELICENSQIALNYSAPKIAPVLLQYGFSAIYLTVSYFMYKRRKAEIAGFLGSNTVVTSIGTFIISAAVIFMAGEMFISYSGSMASTLLFCAAAIFVVYSVIEIVSHRSLKIYAKKMWKLPIHFAVFGAMILMFSTGFFGYSSELPDIDKVKSVSVSTGTNDIFMFDYNSHIAYSSGNYNSFLHNDGTTADAGMIVEEGSAAMMEGFTEKSEIEHVKDIHKMLIDLKGADDSGAGFGERIVDSVTVIVYTMEDGTKLERMYTKANDEIRRELSKLTATENYIRQSADFFATRMSQAAHLDVTLLSPNYTSAYLAPEFDSKEECMLLVNSIRDDILSGNLPLDFNTDSSVVGYIGFNDGKSGIFNEESDFLSAFSADDFTITVPVYESMENTLKVLEENNCTDYLKNSHEPVKVEKWKLDDTAKSGTWIGGITTMLEGFWFSGKGYTESYYDEYSYGEEGVYAEYAGEDVIVDVEAPPLAETSVEVTDPDEMKLLSDNIRMITLDCFDGYYVKLTYADGSASYGYVPLSLIK